MTKGPGIDVTVYTDASWHHEEGVGAWGLWLRTSEIRRIEVGPVPRYVTDSSGAELAAIFAAVHRAKTVIAPEPLRILYIRSDCQTALRAAERGAGLSGNAGIAKLQKLIWSTLHANVRMQLKWVPGHASGQSTAAYLNREVDKKCGEASRKMRDLVRQHGKGVEIDYRAIASFKQHRVSDRPQTLARSAEDCLDPDPRRVSAGPPAGEWGGGVPGTNCLPELPPFDTGTFHWGGGDRSAGGQAGG